jgi:hypothetical protein
MTTKNPPLNSIAQAKPPRRILLCQGDRRIRIGHKGQRKKARTRNQPW